MTEPSRMHDIQERMVALTRDLILIPSIPSRPDDRRRCYEFIRNHLESLDDIEIREFEDKGIPSLVAAPPGCHEPEILMCGHLDVISHPDISVYRSSIENGRIYGPGAGDMKGSLAIILEVFRQIHSRLPRASLGVAITSDEETGGESGIGYLVNKEGIRCKQAMIPDGGSLNEITIEEKGIIHMRISCQGATSHAARPWLGSNPIVALQSELAKIKTMFDAMRDDKGHWHPTGTVTIIGTGNETFNRIPSNAYAVLDVRFPSPFTVSTMLSKIKDQLVPETNVEVMISAEPTNLSPDLRFKAITEKVLGQEVRLVRDDGGSDGRFLSAKGIPVLISRPLVGNLHAVDEWIDIASMTLFYQIYESYLLDRLSEQDFDNSHPSLTEG